MVVLAVFDVAFLNVVNDVIRSQDATKFFYKLIKTFGILLKFIS